MSVVEISSESQADSVGKDAAPSKEEVIAKRELLFADMNDEAINRMITTIASANLRLEAEYIYGNFWLFRGNGGLKTATTPVFISIKRHSTFG